jgi:type I restriction enzyme M protein
MITGSLRSKIDKLWLEFHSGGIANPLTVIEQISFLMFARMLDMQEARNEKRAQRTGKKNKDAVFSAEQQHLRWSHLVNLGAEEQLRLVQEELFPFFRKTVAAGSSLGRYLQDAQCVIQKPRLLKTAINMINDLPLARGDTKGDLYEYLLSKLTTAGVAGQFRTPRHIIRAMVEMLDVGPADKVCDPACGTGGFLIECMDYLKRTHSSPELVHEETDAETGEVAKDHHGQPIMIYPGDLLEDFRGHIQKEMFHGFDFDATMLRIAAMNMLLHGIDAPCIENRDSLSEQTGIAQSHESEFDIVLANPPFKGSVDYESVFKKLTAVTKTKKTELLFLVLMVRILKNGGKCAVIVPDGVLFGSSKAHLAVRKLLVDDNQLEGVISLPSGVFKPYAGVSTAVLLFTKGGETKDVWFYRVKNDGYSLDDKRTPIPGDDLPDLVTQWKKRNPRKKSQRTDKHFFVPKSEIVEKKYDLSYNRYAEVKYEEVKCDPPKVILGKLKELQKEITADMVELEEMLG